MRFYSSHLTKPHLSRPNASWSTAATLQNSSCSPRPPGEGPGVRAGASTTQIEFIAMKNLYITSAFAALLTLLITFSSRAEDWPQWRGVRADGSWNGPKLPETWPKDGLKQRWKMPVGGGYAGVVVA